MLQKNDPAPALEAAEPIICSLIRKYRYRIRKSDVDDVKQSLRLRLLETIISKFDPARGSLHSYLFKAIENTLKSEIRKLKAIKRRGCEVLDDGDMVAQNEPGADAILRELLNNPSNHLSQVKVKLLDSIISTSSRAELADRLGISASAAHKRVNRLCDDLREIAQN